MPVSEVLHSRGIPVSGIKLSAVKAGIRYPDRLDLVLIEICAGSTVSGVYTQNAFCAAPVLVAKKHVSVSPSRYFLVNTGNANAGTGESGELDAIRCCDVLAEITGTEVSEIAPFSTGVIGEKLPVEKILTGLPSAMEALSGDNWQDAAIGIMTTDTKPKFVSTQIYSGGTPITITGIAKGAGMIKPNMATMLAFIFTDAKIDKPLLDRYLHQAVNKSFNRITVDGDTSTNDCCMLVATGKSAEINGNDTQSQEFAAALVNVFTELAKGLIKDAEGASKFITLHILNGSDEAECLKVAYAIAESPLVKTAMFASDPNWGRILAAIGRAGIDALNIELIEIALGDVSLVKNGGVCPTYSEAKGQLEMNKAEITVSVNLNRGTQCESVWTSDLSNEYVRINADYRS